jgi:tetratricopeptide (TPR) repeat protein
MSASKLIRVKKQIIAKDAINLMKDEKYMKAIDLFTKAIHLDPNDCRLYNNRSFCFHKLNQLKEALNDANSSVQLDDKQIAGHYRKGFNHLFYKLFVFCFQINYNFVYKPNKGCVLMDLKQFRTAQKSFKNALKCDPNDQNSKSKLDEIERLFLNEFGFNQKQLQPFIESFDSIEAISDALISGQLIDLIDLGVESVTSVESPRKIPDESELMKSISISNELNFDCDNNEEEDNLMSLADSRDTSNDINSIKGEINEDLIGWKTPDLVEQNSNNSKTSYNTGSNGFRLPKSVPIFGSKSNETTTTQKIIVKSLETTQTTDSNETTPKKIIKTRPLIVRTVVN